jgi:glycine cleavage system regulatory protein
MKMSEHAWVLENLAAYLADGLDAAERERLEQHAAACEACARALAEARNIDANLEALFANARPNPGLEDRLIQALRQAPPRRSLRFPAYARWAVAAAAVVLLGCLGTFVSHTLQQGYLPLPFRFAENRMAAANSLKQLGLPLVEELPSYEAKTKFDISGFDIFDSERHKPASDSPVVLGDTSVNSMAEALQQGIVSGLGRTPPVSSNGTGRAGDTMGAGGMPMRGNMSGQAPPAVPPVALSLDASRSLAVAPLQDGIAVNQPASKKEADPRGAMGLNYYSYFDNTWTAPTGAPAVKLTEPTLTAELKGRGVDVLYFKPADTFGLRVQDTPPLSTATGVVKELKDRERFADPRGKADVAQKDRKEAKPAAPEPNPRAARKIIRSGEIEFEVDSFDNSVAAITKLLGDTKGGFIATVNSDKLANGKVRGSVVVRLPPEQLDRFLLALRKELSKTGELKGQRIGSQDITKQYTDLESRLRAARAMEDRLIQIIKTGKGEIKDLVLAEKELGVWRTKIEETEGELRYYANLVALSTLTINLTEKEIRAPASITQTERIQMGIEVEDVEKAQRAVLVAVAAAKGRVLKAELKQHSAGQFSAVLHFEVTPEAAGPLRDRLKQIGHVARLDIDRLRQADDGSAKSVDPKLIRHDVVFQLSLYNLVNIAPRETVHISLAAADAEQAFQTILARVRKTAGRVVTSNLNRQRNDQTSGTIHFEVKTDEADAVLAALKQVGEVMSLRVTENADTQNVTAAKRGFQVQLWALGAVPPRQTDVLQVATQDVPAGFRDLQAAVDKAKGRTLNAQLHEQDRQNVTAQLDFEVRREEKAAVEAALAAAGDTIARTVTRAQASENAIDSKVRYQVKLVNLTALQPRESLTLGVEVRDVEQTAAAFVAYVAEAHGQVTQSHLARERNGRVTAKLVFDVPLATAPGLVERFRAAGVVRAQQATRNLQVPAGKLALARLDVTLSNAELILPSEEGFWPQIRTGLKTSLLAIAWSLTVVIVGVCFVLPWVLVLYGLYLLVSRLRRRAPAAQQT